MPRTSPWEIDLNRISIREYRRLFDSGQSEDEENETIARAAGLTVDELLDLPQPEYRKLVAEFFRKAREPLGNDEKN